MRRHLDTSQRALIAARFATMPHGGDRKSSQEPISALDLSVLEAADLLNVGKSSVKDARTVLASGDPETIEAVERGDVSNGTNSSISETAETAPTHPASGAKHPASPGRGPH